VACLSVTSAPDDSIGRWAGSSQLQQPNNIRSRCHDLSAQHKLCCCSTCYVVVTDYNRTLELQSQLSTVLLNPGSAIESSVFDRWAG